MIAGIDYLDDNAAQALAEAPVMARRCADCAFTHGTDAHLSVTTRRIARECVSARHAFWCHKSGDEFKTHLCAGWVEAISDAAKV